MSVINEIAYFVHQSILLICHNGTLYSKETEVTSFFGMLVQDLISLRFLQPNQIKFFHQQDRYIL